MMAGAVLTSTWLPQECIQPAQATYNSATRSFIHFALTYHRLQPDGSLRKHSYSLSSHSRSRYTCWLCATYTLSTASQTPSQRPHNYAACSGGSNDCTAAQLTPGFLSPQTFSAPSASSDQTTARLHNWLQAPYHPKPFPLLPPLPQLHLYRPPNSLGSYVSHLHRLPT